MFLVESALYGIRKAFTFGAARSYKLSARSSSLFFLSFKYLSFFYTTDGQVKEYAFIHFCDCDPNGDRHEGKMQCCMHRCFVHLFLALHCIASSLCTDHLSSKITCTFLFPNQPDIVTTNLKASTL